MSRVAHFRDTPTVAILGAGASRGEIFDGYDVACLPPLNADFFTQLQKIDHAKHSQTIRDVLNDIHSFFGPNWSLTLEEYFTQIEFFNLTLKYDTKLNKKFLTQLASARKSLFQALSATLEESIPNEALPLHNKLVDLLAQGDAILSFNYDTLIDSSLKGRGDNKWSAETGYGFPVRTCEVTGIEHWNPQSPVRKGPSIKLLKLHGSIHWKISEDGSSIHLKQRTHKQNKDPKFSIIPPEWNKSGKNNLIYNRLWSLAAESLSKSKNVIMIGYSFSNNDLHSSALFRLALRHPLERIIIVNPNQDARRRARTALEGGIGPATIISQFESFKDFCDSGIYEVLKTGKLKGQPRKSKSINQKAELATVVASEIPAEPTV